MAVIYEFVNKQTNKKYIGQTTDYKRRIREHKFNYKNSIKNTPLYNALRKYGWEEFSINIIEQCDRSILNEREEYWIEYYSSVYPNGYNLLKGGNQVSHTEETKNKISKNRLGIKFSETHIENLKKSHIGYVMPEEQKIKISNSSRGKTFSYETRKKLKLSQPHRKVVGRFDIYGNLIKTYESISEASKELNCSSGNISECCTGKRKLNKLLNGDTLKFIYSWA